MQTKEKLIELFTTMLRIRLFEEKVADEVQTGNIKTPCHLYIGQEAVATGICANLEKEDVIYGNHRSHGHYIAKGGDINALMAEIYCKADGCSKGKGGSMHVISVKDGVYGTPPIVAGTIPIATGTALAFKIMNKRNVAVSFFGDGATNEGSFYESLNIAALYNLPILFVCENNLYATHMKIASCSSNIDIASKAKAFCMDSITIDGNDVIKTYDTMSEVVNDVRKKNRPILIEALTYRWRGHVGPNFDIDKSLRSKEEVEEWMKKCPIKQIENLIIEKGFADHNEIENIKKSVANEILDAYKYAMNSPYPSEMELSKGVFCQ